MFKISEKLFEFVITLPLTFIALVCFDIFTQSPVFAFQMQIFLSDDPVRIRSSFSSKYSGYLYTGGNRQAQFIGKVWVDNVKSLRPNFTSQMMALLSSPADTNLYKDVWWVHNYYFKDYTAWPRQKDLSDIGSLVSPYTDFIPFTYYGRLHKWLKVQCIKSQSIVAEGKQNYYHPLSVSVKAH